MRLLLCALGILCGLTLSLPSAEITIVGSSTVGDVLTRVAQGWRSQGNTAVVTIIGSGSNSALPALGEGKAAFATLSRPLAESEIDAFLATRGLLIELVIGYDALAVFVHRDNPLTAITLAQLDGAFGAERRRGSNPIRRWGELNLPEPWTTRPLSLIGSDSHGGAHALMRDLALKGGTFTAAMTQEPVASSVVQGVGTDPNAIGCASVSLITKRTRIVPVGETLDGAFLPTAATCFDGSYPLARPLIMCWNPKVAMSPEARAFLDFVISPEGQEVIANMGYFPLGRLPEMVNHLPKREGK